MEYKVAQVGSKSEANQININIPGGYPCNIRAGIKDTVSELRYLIEYDNLQAAGQEEPSKIQYIW